jgi:Cohesin domain
VAIDPPLSAADVGSSFQVSVVINNVNSLVGYDVLVTYDPTVLSCTGVTFNKILPNPYYLPAFNLCSDLTSSAETAGVSVQTSGISLSSATPVMTLTYKVLQAVFTTIHIAKAQLAVLPGPTAAPVMTFDGTFAPAPKLSFILPNATVVPSQRLSRISDHAVQVTLQGFILMDSSNVRAGFGAVSFVVIDPTTATTTLQSDIAFMFPGGSGIVNATYTFATSGYAIGEYHIIATLLRCTTNTLDSCIPGQTTTGLFFKLKS